MMKSIFASTAAVARLAPLRDWRRCATGAAARLAPLRGTINIDSFVDDGKHVHRSTGAVAVDL